MDPSLLLYRTAVSCRLVDNMDTIGACFDIRAEWGGFHDSETSDTPQPLTLSCLV